MKTLFDETHLGNIALKNRIIRSATYEGLADETGHMTNRFFKAYQDLAEGGVGLIITGVTNITQKSKYLTGMMEIYDDSFIEDYKRLTDMSHMNDCPMLIRLPFAGSGGVLWTPSNPSTAELEAILQPFDESALRAKRAGFDGIQIHAAHNYFLSQLLNNRQNTRRDEYGGSLENQARILLGIYAEIREKINKDFHVSIKINCTDLDGNHKVFTACRYVCAQLAIKGINSIEISAGTGPFNLHPAFDYSESVLRDYAAQIAEETKVPIILVGLNRTPAVMEEILNTKNIEYFSISRPLLKRSHLVNEWQNTHESNILRKGW